MPELRALAVVSHLQLKISACLGLANLIFLVWKSQRE